MQQLATICNYLQPLHELFRLVEAAAQDALEDLGWHVEYA